MLCMIFLTSFSPFEFFHKLQVGVVKRIFLIAKFPLVVIACYDGKLRTLLNVFRNGLQFRLALFHDIRLKYVDFFYSKNLISNSYESIKIHI